MSKRVINLMSSTQQVLEKMGANIKKARLRRNLSSEFVAEQAQISTDTLTSIALDEEGKKKFWEQNLKRRERASKRREEI